MHDIDTLLETAINAARAAGARLLEGASKSKAVNAHTAKDIKLQADVDSETLIRELLSPLGLPIIGEEKGGDESLPGKDLLYWVVDPLDGTYNYFRNLPPYCVIIGLMRGQEPVLGVIYDFQRDEMYSARADGDLFLNGERVNPTWAESIDKACVATGFPATFDYSSASLKRLFTLIQRFNKTRMTGSAGMASVYVATGQIDVYYEESVRLWDIAGGLALVKAAGGHVEIEPVNNAPFAYNVWMVGKKEFIIRD